MARNNGLSLVARLNISLSESQISDDLKKISDSLNDKSLPSFIAHINVQGSAAAINKELESLGKKLKVDFGKITEGTNKGKLKEAGKKVAQQVYNVHELKAAGQDYLYNANDIQKQIDQLQSRYDKRNVSLQNSVNVSALTNEVGQVKALRVEYENLEHQMVRVDYIKAKFDNKKWGFVSTGANYIDKTEGKAYQETLSYMTKIESSFRKIHDSAIGFSSPIKEGSKFFDEYNAKAGKVAQTITEIRSENKILSDEQKTYISSLVSSFEAYVKNLKEAAKGATSLSPKNLSESIKQSNAELNTMLKNLTKNKQETGFLGNEYKKIYEDISGLRTQLNSVTNGEEFALYSANLKLVREGVKQYNSDVANSTANQKLKSDMDDVNAKIMTFIRENKNLTDSYKQNLLDLAGKANQAKSGFELKGISGQANALMNAYNKSEDMSRSIRTLNSSLTVSEQKLLEMQNDTMGLDVEFQRLVDRTNEVRTNLGDVSTQSGLKNVKVEVAETKQAINDLYNTWQSRQIANQKMVANQTLNSMSEKLLAQRNDLYGLDTEYRNFSDRIVDIQNRLATTADKIGFNRISAEISTLNSQLNGFYNQINARQGTTLFNENVQMQMVKIDQNARSVSSSIARNQDLMHQYEQELNRVWDAINNITSGAEVLSQTQQMEVRRLVENFKMYETELQNIAKTGLKPNLQQNISVYNEQLTSMLSKLNSMSAKVPDNLSNGFNNVRATIRQLQNELGSVTEESDLTNFIVNFKILNEQFNQLSSAVNGQTTIDNLTNKISTLDTKMEQYLRTVTNIAPAQRAMLENLRNQLNASFTIPEFESIKTQWDNLVTSIATEQQRIGGVPLEDKLLHTQEVLVTLRTSVIAHQQEVGSLGSSYGQLISEIDRFITDINNGAITSKDDFEIMENSIGQLQERIKQTGIEIKSDLNFLSVNNSVRTLVSDINTYLANNLNLPERFRQQAEAIVYELNHTTDKITFDDLKVRWHELVSAINSEVIKVGGVDIAEKVNTGVEALNVLRQTLVSQKGVVGNLDGTYRELLTDIDNLKLAAQNIYSPDQYNAWANDAANVQKRVEQLKNSISSTTGINQLAVQAANLSTKINLFISENSRLSENAKTKLRELANQAQQAQSKMDLSNINTQFNTFTMKLKEAGRLGTSIIDKLKQNISKFSAWFGMTTIIMRVITLMRQMITNVKELDTAMVNLKKVTDETDQSYQNFFKRAGESAQELHADMTNLIDATAEFSKLGYNIGQAEELAKIATVYKNVGELDSIEDATSSIVSTIKAFKEYTNEVEAASHATDVFNAVGNTEAVSSKDLGEILKRSASAMAVAGNSLNETAALGAAGNTIVQDSAMLGTALKTLSLRLTSTKVKLEEIGEETEYAAETTSDYRDKVLALTATTSKPVDILGSDGQYKNTYNILKDISEVWKEMNSMEQSAMLKMLFGVRQTNVGAAILTNFDIAERALKTAENASEGIGSAMEEHNRWADSLEARINDVNSSLQVLSTDVFSTDGIKEFVSSVNDLVQAIDWVVKKFDVVKIAFSAFSAWMLNTKNIISATVTETGSKINLFGHQWSIFTNSATQANQAMELQVSTASSITKSLQMYNSTLGQSSRLNTQLATTIPTTTMQQYLVSLNGAEASMQGYVTWLAQSSVVTENANMVITRYKSITSLGADAQAIFRSEVAKTNPTMAQYLATTNAASMSQKNYQSYLRKTELQTKATTLATQALNIAMSLGVTAAITGFIQWVGNLADKYNDLLQKSSELRTEFETQVGTLTNLRKQYEELMTSTVDEKTKNERLTEIKKALVEQYGFEEDKIRKINQLRAEGLGLIDEEIARQRQDAIGKTEDVFNKALGQVSKARTSYSIVDTFAELGVKVKNLRPEIKSLFEEVEGGIAGTDFQLNADNPLEFKRKLEEVRSELISVRTETGKFNKDEQNLFDNISHILDELYADPDSKVPLIGGIINWASDFMPSEKDFEEVEKGLELRAKAVYEAYVKRVRKTFEEASGTVDYASWLEGLYQQTKDVYGDEYFTYYKTAFDDMFKSIRLSFNDNIVPASDDFDAIEALVLKAKQGLSELDGTADKAAKSLDELDKVMKDNKDADKFFSAKDIVELLDKYPELADAIEKTEYGYKLNEKALEELKKKQLEEKKATLQAELDKSRIVLREAKRRLEAKKAEYEAITEAERNFIGPVRGDQLNKVKLYGDYNRSVKQLQDAEKTVSKIQMQIDVLDPDFKDIADSTADTKANLDDARKSLDKMKDDMDDAKKYVEDLLKLTMDMIMPKKAKSVTTGNGGIRTLLNRLECRKAICTTT